MSHNWKLYLHEANYLVLGEGFAYTSPIIIPIETSNVPFFSDCCITIFASFLSSGGFSCSPDLTPVTLQS